jgi:hypothetical protein
MESKREERMVKSIGEIFAEKRGLIAGIARKPTSGISDFDELARQVISDDDIGAATGTGAS